VGREPRAALPGRARLQPRRAQLQDEGREIDLIFRKEKTLVFVEVKLRRGTAYGDPLEAVTARKQTTLRKLVVEYLSDRNPHFDTLRIHVVGILVGKDGLRVRHVQGAF
jgi:putative endonuclease